MTPAGGDDDDCGGGGCAAVVVWSLTRAVNIPVVGGAVSKVKSVDPRA